ncbi:MAG: Na+:solute symporter [Sedimentisphaerales bacterium]|nr:Na+:solute symporter [Sedimentisphaerales bacterium]
MDMVLAAGKMLSGLDIGIVIAYLVIIVIAGVWLSRRAGQNMESYFLGGKRIPWYFLGIANASGMFDITGTMWLVMLLFVYGMKSVWIPWVWPVFNQVFLMVYLSVWLRRSNVMTGAEWLRTRFGKEVGSELSHISIVIFALISVIGFLAYAFQGVGKFAAIFFPWDWAPSTYAMIFMGITTIYVILGGMYSVVLTDIIQFSILTIASVFIAILALNKVSPDMISRIVPHGWENLFFDWHLSDLDWSGTVASVNETIKDNNYLVYGCFGAFFMMMLFKGILSSAAGPAPNYDMQKILSTRSPREASLMSFCTITVLFIPRFLLIGGIGVLALAFFEGSPMQTQGGKVDFEQVLPFVINNYLSPGLVGLVLAGLLAAFMSTFDCTVNAGASYIVNDIYKRYINPSAPEKRYVFISYLASIVIVIVGVTFGFLTDSINSICNWIVNGLYAGYIVPNVLKWHWWRFNGYGYFAGMVAGILFAMFMGLGGILPADIVAGNELLTRVNSVNELQGFPILLLLSGLASIVVSLLTPADNEQTLKEFYKNVRPWGLWRPIREKVLAENPAFIPNRAFCRDAINVVVGIVWQTSMVTTALYLIIKNYQACGISIAVLVITSVFLKFNWYNKLEEN